MQCVLCLYLFTSLFPTMARITPSSLVSEIRGSVGENTYSKNRYGAYVKSKLIQTNPDSAGQQTRREAFSDGVAEWQALSDTEAQKWIFYARENLLFNTLGQGYKRSGFNEYIYRCVNRSVINGSLGSFNPLPRVRSRPIQVSTSFDTDQMEISWLLDQDNSNISLVVYASPPLKPSVRSINPSLLTAIAVINDPDQSGTIDIFTDYIAAHCATELNNGNRIGICVKVVNSDNFDASGKVFTSALATNVFTNIPGPGYEWTIQTSAADIIWNAITYSNGLFVAIATNGFPSQIMTSPDGITWTLRTSPVDRVWQSITYGNGLFVAVASSGTGNRIITSPDGITWTARVSPADNNWQGVVYANGIFVAVADSGTGNRVMTSLDGINWELQVSAADNNWQAIAYGKGLFVACSNSGVSNRIMTSPDGINWTIRASTQDYSWISMAFGNGVFVVIQQSPIFAAGMISSDGINWLDISLPGGQAWTNVIFANGVFIGVSNSGGSSRVMTSQNGVDWDQHTVPVTNQWRALAYGQCKAVAVAGTGTGNRVMTSP